MQVSLPHLICLNETLLDDPGFDPQLGGYKLISRRDRDDGRAGGGIAVFALDGFAEQVIFLSHSTDHERSWHTLLTDLGPVLLGAWYRPPCHGETASIRTCEDEWRKLADEHVATILVGDLNVHHTRWLRHSASISVEGTSMYRFCATNGLRQLVKRPTRDAYLLDLVISDMPARKVEILPKVSDHNMVLADFDFGVSETECVTRTVFDYSKGDWDKVRRDLKSFDWRPIDVLSVDDAERYLHDGVLNILGRHIPSRVLHERKSAHPWVNDRCLSAIRMKNAAVGTDNSASEAKRCSDILFEEYLSYVRRMRDKLGKAKRGSKHWWKLANEIMNKDPVSASIPALRSESGWAHDPTSKANVLADTFASKSTLPTMDHNEYSFFCPERVHDSFILVRSAHVSRFLAKIDADSGTGPDGLAARVLKLCSRELGLPLAKLVRRIISQSRWPSEWTVHWLMPLHKRKTKADPINYRAINLTAQISKVVERFLCPCFTPTLELRAFGATQFAYRKKHGARDAVLFYVLSWVAALNDGCKVGVYCSDVVGAFDRVDAELLMRKLAAFNLNIRLLRVIRSWLRDRRGFVIVNGKKSNGMRLRDMVFQGTVWGPSLWNAFFGDCVCAIQTCDFEAVIYADDCNAFKRYPSCFANRFIFEDLRECQLCLHKWGQANAVSFDAGKEETMIISTTDACGGPAKLLGIDFDNKLIMAMAAHKCAKKAAWKSKSLLRVRRFYSTPDLVMLFKSHVLSFIEYRTAGIHFASTTALVEVAMS